MEHFRIPLLLDHHTHPLLYAAFMGGVDLGRFPDDGRDEAVARIRAHPAREEWRIAYGWNSARYPLSRSDFDGLGPTVVLNLSLHGLVVNDAGLARLRAFDAEIAAGLGDQEWVERNLRRVLNAFVEGGATVDRLERFFRWLLEEHGVYHAAEMLLVDAREVALFEAAGLGARTTLWAPPALYAALPASARARVHGVKLFADGAIGAWTAALAEPYRGSAGSGMLLYDDDALASEMSPHVEAGRALAVHAIGDRAIDQVLRVLEGLGAPSGEVRIEHAQLISLEAAGRARDMGVSLCMQPNFSDDSLHYADRLPGGYPERNNPFRMLIDEVGFVPGVDLVFGSDGMPHGAREALRQALFPPFASQALSLEEFVAGYCVPAGTGPAALAVEVDRANRAVGVTLVGYAGSQGAGRGQLSPS